MRVLRLWHRLFSDVVDAPHPDTAVHFPVCCRGARRDGLWASLPVQKILWFYRHCYRVLLHPGGFLAWTYSITLSYFSCLIYSAKMLLFAHPTFIYHLSPHNSTSFTHHMWVNAKCLCSQHHCQVSLKSGSYTHQKAACPHSALGFLTRHQCLKKHSCPHSSLFLHHGIAPDAPNVKDQLHCSNAAISSDLPWEKAVQIFGWVYFK